MNKPCWWCGGKADSREHIFKKTDHTRVFGKPPYTEKSQPLIQSGPTNFYKVQGPNSDSIKFKANLCQNCNNNRSSDFDKSYSLFIDGIKPYFFEIVKNGAIDLTNIFQANWSAQKEYLIKYFIKHIGCRLSHEEIVVPKNLINYLDSKEDLLDARIQFEVRPLNHIFAEATNEGTAEINSFEILYVGQSKVIWLDNSQIQLYLSWLTTGWMSVNYIIEKDINKDDSTTKKVSPILQFRVGPINPPIEFFNVPVLSKQNLIEDFDRISNEAVVKEFYQRIKYSII